MLRFNPRTEIYHPPIDYTYVVEGFTKFCEEDDYEQGCIGDTSSYTSEEVFKAKKLNDLVKKLMSSFGIENIDDVNVIEEESRIDFQTVEDVDGNKASQSQIDSWKKGETKLFLCTYIVYVKVIYEQDVKNFSSLDLEKLKTNPAKSCGCCETIENGVIRFTRCLKHSKQLYDENPTIKRKGYTMEIDESEIKAINCGFCGEPLFLSSEWYGYDCKNKCAEKRYSKNPRTEIYHPKPIDVKNYDLYYELIKAGVRKEDIDHHESDLYVKVTPTSAIVIEKSPYKDVRKFVDIIGSSLWYEIPFAFNYFGDIKRLEKTKNPRTEIFHPKPKLSVPIMFVNERTGQTEYIECPECGGLVDEEYSDGGRYSQFVCTDCNKKWNSDVDMEEKVFEDPPQDNPRTEIFHPKPREIRVKITYEKITQPDDGSEDFDIETGYEDEDGKLFESWREVASFLRCEGAFEPSEYPNQGGNVSFRYAGKMDTHGVTESKTYHIEGVTKEEMKYIYDIVVHDIKYPEEYNPQPTIPSPDDISVNLEKYRTAIGEEYKAVALYNEMMDLSSNTDEKEMLKHIRDEEVEHLDELKSASGINGQTNPRTEIWHPDSYPAYNLIISEGICSCGVHFKLNENEKTRIKRGFIIYCPSCTKSMEEIALKIWNELEEERKNAIINENPKRRRRLICSCCGKYFLGNKDPQHDKGYGTCPSCVEYEKSFDMKKNPCPECGYYGEVVTKTGKIHCMKCNKEFSKESWAKL